LSDPVNLGSGEEISMNVLAQQIKDLVGFSGSIFWDTSKPNGQPRRPLDVSRARERLGFQATISWAEELKQTYGWLLNSGVGPRQ
jgi:GDP-L-fucose synthase